MRLRNRRETDRPCWDRERQKEISDVETAEQSLRREIEIMWERQRETRAMETDDEREVRLEGQIYVYNHFILTNSEKHTINKQVITQLLKTSLNKR